MTKKQFFLTISLATGLSCVFTVVMLYSTKPHAAMPSFDQKQQAHFVNYLADSSAVVPEGLNFIYASEIARPAVVHIRVTLLDYSRETHDRGMDPLEDFFHFFNDGKNGPPPTELPSHPMASGSGVILSSDGYIVTNNHVVEKGATIEVVLDDKRRYFAKVVGTDPTTDLALLKIGEQNLPFLRFGDSEKMRIGEWVLAVGNPFELTSTVTAGIISAKGRNLNLLRENNNNLQIESFIQTDAAVNPGNSGGALVNLKGELIGINTAILGGLGGTYTGYSFAIPSILAKKVVDDLLKYGEVQRGLLGVEIREIDAQFKEEKELDRLDGVYVNMVNKGSAAADAGLKSGDIIIAINKEKVKKVTELQQKIALYRPGQSIDITYVRNKKEYTVKATLKNKAGTTAIVKRSSEEDFFKKLGATFREATLKEKSKFSMKGGIVVETLKEGKLREAGVKEGFIIISINKRPIYTVKELETIISNSSGGILIEGLYTDGSEGVYAINNK